MARDNPDSPRPSSARRSGTSFDRSEERAIEGGLYEDISMNDDSVLDDTAAKKPRPQPGLYPFYLFEDYKYFVQEEFEKFRALITKNQNDVHWMREWIKANSKNFIDSKYCKEALIYLCQTYASEQHIQELERQKWHIGYMLSVIEIILSGRGGQKETLHDPSTIGETRVLEGPLYDSSTVGEALILDGPLYDLSAVGEARVLEGPMYDSSAVGEARILDDPSTDEEARVSDNRQISPPKSSPEFFAKTLKRLDEHVREDARKEREMFKKAREMYEKEQDLFGKEREILRTSPQQEYSEQRLDDSLLIDETPPRQRSRSSPPPSIRITPPSPKYPRSRTPSPKTPFVSKSRFGFTDPTVPPGELNIPPGPFEIPTPFRKTVALSSPKRAEPLLVNIGVDPKPLIDTESGERFICDISIDVQPGVSGMQSQLPYVRSHSSPYPLDTSADTSRERTLSPVIKRRFRRQYNVPRKATPTSTGIFTPRIYRSPRPRRVPGKYPISDLPWSPTYLPEDARPPVTSLSSPPYLSDTSISWERSGESYYGSSPYTSSESRQSPSKHRSPDFWESSASPVIKGPFYRHRTTASSPSPVIKGPTYRHRSTTPSPSAEIKRHHYARRSPDFWSRPIQSPFSEVRSQSLKSSFSPHRSERLFDPSTVGEARILDRPLYDPSTRNEARFLDDSYSSPSGSNGRPLYDPSTVGEARILDRPIYDPSTRNEARFLDDSYSSPSGSNGRPLYDPSTVGEARILDRPIYDPSTRNEARFLDDSYSSPSGSNGRPLYDPSTVGEARILDRPIYDPSTRNEARFLDDSYSSPSSSNGRPLYDPSTVGEARVLDRPLYDPSTRNEARFLDDSYSSASGSNGRPLYDPSAVGEARILDNQTYDPSTVGEARFLDNSYSSSGGSNVEYDGDYLEESLYDSSIVGEGRFLD